MADIIKIYRNSINPGINASIDLGSSGLKWKDLFLSGDINLGNSKEINFGSDASITTNSNNQLVIKDVDGTNSIYNLPSRYQTTLSIIQNATTNINGRALTNYSSVDIVVSDIYPAKKLFYNGSRLSREQAENYMEFMTGSKYLPVYNFEKPRNSLFVMPDLTLWKPQYDENNGLILFKFSTEVQVKLVSGVNIKTINGNSILGSGDLSTDPAIISNNDIDSLFVGILNN